MYLSYIYLAHGLYCTNLAYPKEIYIYHKINIYKIYYIYNIIILKPSIFFHCDIWLYDYIIICDSDSDIILNPNPNKIKIKIREIWNKVESNIHNSDTWFYR